MKASIIIPTYNGADVVIRSLETWTKQSLPASDFEVIVVDNNSSDGSGEKIQEFIKPYPHFHYVFETGKGSTKARHAGAKIAKSEIFVFCDNDGLFNEECIKEILNVYEQNADVKAVTGKVEVLWDNTPPDWIEPYLFMLGELDYGDKVKCGTDLYLNGGIFSIKKEIFEELGGFNPDLFGDYLIGDGDTGLVIKLHENNLLIGYTPFAVMKHLQFVGRHGTVSDMGRRFYNVGISTSYGIFRKNKFKINALVIRYMLKSLVFLLKKKSENYFFKKNKQKAYFSYMQRKGELAFFYNLRKKEVRKEIVKTTKI